MSTLQQILHSKTEQKSLRRDLQSSLDRSPLDQPAGIETLQMMMKSLPPSDRELQMIIGDSKENFTTVPRDILDRIDSPRIEIPVDAPLTFDVNKFITENKGEDYTDVIDLDEEFLYEEVDQSRQSLSSAFISSKDPFTVTLSPTSSLLAQAGDLVFLKFILTNRGPVTKFFLSSGVGGVVTHTDSLTENTRKRETVPRQRMVFPGEISIIQTLEPEMILLNTNQSEEIKLGVRLTTETLADRVILRDDISL